MAFDMRNSEAFYTHHLQYLLGCCFCKLKPTIHYPSINYVPLIKAVHK